MDTPGRFIRKSDFEGIEMTNEPTQKRHGPMSIEQILKVDQRIQRMAENAAPSLVSDRHVVPVLAEKIARTMAYHKSIPDSSYIQELVLESFNIKTARRIVKKARALAAAIEVPVVIHQPTASPTPAPVVTPASVPAPTSGGGSSSGGGGSGGVVGKEKTVEAAEKHAPASAQPEPVIQLRNGDENQAGDVWVEKARKYVPKSKLISGFRKLNGDVWDAEKREFIPGNSIKHGHVRIEDGWQWHSSLRMYRNPDRNVPDPWESDDPEINRLYRD
ncbi:hypothetical protein HFQ13_05425 [Acidithiobacillus sp. VAN18-1]|uniref:Uncharacterized protein n=1 Tax=Igneacidithiobacillus copahuensis TaxID=2724909 RepID=A0AAE2YP38_9PROT|nr:hypothetical protein [Igneacidithiobacillus copahuensis]MBU2787651.1 hypothetical protein [Igneacidithiobacillus copahuensis]MBU2795987.1 hypothetical protein [Acidithiobacillus sp. VAN18-2]